MATDYLDPLRKRLAKFASDRDWEKFHSPKNLSMALIAEAAELVEHFQWLSEQQSLNLPDDKKHQISLELADIFIYLIRCADQLHIDLLAAVDEKIAINEKRYPIAKVYGSAKRASEYEK